MLWANLNTSVRSYVFLTPIEKSTKSCVGLLQDARTWPRIDVTFLTLRGSVDAQFQIDAKHERVHVASGVTTSLLLESPS